MANMESYTSQRGRSGCVLKQIFDREMDDFIADEQIDRILKVVIDMIDSGEFDKKFVRKIKSGYKYKNNNKTS